MAKPWNVWKVAAVCALVGGALGVGVRGIVDPAELAGGMIAFACLGTLTVILRNRIRGVA